MKTIFFDYDGTIHESMRVYRPAVIQAIEFLNELGYEVTQPTETMFYDFIGKNPQDMWSDFVPFVKEEHRTQASTIVSTAMESLILKGNAMWYHGALDTLQALKQQGHQLVLISNCKNYYLEAHNKMFQLDQIFDRLIASQAFNYQSKSKIIEILRDQFYDELIMVGDRYLDIQAGKDHHMKTFGAAYGYGCDAELMSADQVIGSISELIGLIGSM